jgi:hypothetical protein
VALHVDRPLGLSEILAETIRLYGERAWSALALGALYTSVLVIGEIIHPVAYFALASVAFGLTFAAAARLAAGDSFGEAWSQVALRIPVLLVLSVAVALPFLIASTNLLLLLVGVAWLAGAGFAVPVAVLERDPEADSRFRRVGYALERAVALARVEYLHALGVAAALVLVNVLFGVILAGLLAGFADNSAVAARLLAQLVLTPFFFLGLSVLYFEQRTRAKPGTAQPSEG